MLWLQDIFAQIPILADRASSQSDKLTKAWENTSPEERLKSYNKARRSILGDLPTSEDPTIIGCQAESKKARREERKALIEKAKNCSNECKDTATRLGSDMDEVEYMRCALQVYMNNDADAPPDLRNGCPPGFRNPTDDELAEMGLDREMLSDGEFRAAVYMKDESLWGENPNPPAVLAFRGSTRAKADWSNNFDQNADRDSSYYQRAVLIGNMLKISGANVQIVGHSLGGGLASAAQGGSGLPTSTYNAAGLHPNTVKRYSKLTDRVAADPDKIKAIRVRGEELTYKQEKHWLYRQGANEAVGQRRELEPATSEDEWKRQKSKKDDDRYDGYLHSMTEVIASMEKSKKADEAKLRTCGPK